MAPHVCARMYVHVYMYVHSVGSQQADQTHDAPDVVPRLVLCVPSGSRKLNNTRSYPKQLRALSERGCLL
jgi:hypothetical protein